VKPNVVKVCIMLSGSLDRPLVKIDSIYFLTMETQHDSEIAFPTPNIKSFPSRSREPL